MEKKEHNWPHVRLKVFSLMGSNELQTKKNPCHKCPIFYLYMIQKGATDVIYALLLSLHCWGLHGALLPNSPCGIMPPKEHRGLWQHLDRPETELPIESLQKADPLEFTHRWEQDRETPPVKLRQEKVSVTDLDAVPAIAIMCPCVWSSFW